jgi:translation initiation factor IF-3
VRLIAEDGQMVGVVATADALKMAEERGFDLVEVSPDAEPPVCKLIDYGKFKYQQKKKSQQARKKQHVVHIKEVRLRPITEEHDIETKIRHAREFLYKGDKVMIDMVFRGRQIAHKEIGREIVDRVLRELEDIGKIEQRVSMQGSHMTVTIAPKEGIQPPPKSKTAAPPAPKASAAPAARPTEGATNPPAEAAPQAAAAPATTAGTPTTPAGEPPAMPKA